MHIEVPHHAETLLAVSVGALLATIGGFLATLFESHLRRREREKTSALLLGEVLSALKITVKLLEQAHARGDPFGPITIRMVAAVRREVQTYERNRESLYDLRDRECRIAIHSLVASVTVAIDGITEANEAITRLQASSVASASKIDPRLNAYVAGREQSFEFLMALEKRFDQSLLKLAPVAGVTFLDYEDIYGTQDPTFRSQQA